MEFENSRCVVLNASYEPLTIIECKRALCLIIEGKAMVVEEHPYLVVRSVSQSFKVPVMVVLKKFVKSRKIFQSKAVLNQKNLFTRDNYTCQYCSRHKSQLRNHECLTRDHVIPEHKGGLSTWENLVTACSTCNNRKANYYLEDIDMVLAKQPVAPTIFELWMKHSHRRAAFERLEHVA